MNRNDNNCNKSGYKTHTLFCKVEQMICDAHTYVMQKKWLFKVQNYTLEIFFSVLYCICSFVIQVQYVAFVLLIAL